MQVRIDVIHLALASKEKASLFSKLAFPMGATNMNSKKFFHSFGDPSVLFSCTWRYVMNEQPTPLLPATK
jgi:hypothetical protein